MTAKQIAHRLNVHPATVRRLLARGELRGAKVGRAWRIAPRTLDAYFAVSEATICHCGNRIDSIRQGASMSEALEGAICGRCGRKLGGSGA